MISGDLKIPCNLIINPRCFRRSPILIYLEEKTCLRFKCNEACNYLEEPRRKCDSVVPDEKTDLHKRNRKAY